MTAAELETWPYDGDEGDGIVDGEVIEETVESLPLLPVLRESVGGRGRSGTSWSSTCPPRPESVSGGGCAPGGGG
jgi:hypothetical protein